MQSLPPIDAPSKHKRKSKHQVIVIDSDEEDVVIMSETIPEPKKKRVRAFESIKRDKFLTDSDRNYVSEMLKLKDELFMDFIDFETAVPGHQFLATVSQQQLAPSGKKSGKSKSKVQAQKKPSNMTTKAVKRAGQDIQDLIQEQSIEDGTLLSPSASVFLRGDYKHSNLLRFLISGPENTPYQNGLFLFDLSFPDNYPSAPPKVLLVTTGHGSVRFNPNLYKDGKVCLSLLGTWKGQTTAEMWNPQVSSLRQVILSIQTMILGIDWPFYNEPGYGGPSATLLKRSVDDKSSFSSRALDTIKYQEERTIDLTSTVPIIPPLPSQPLTVSSTYYEQQRHIGGFQLTAVSRDQQAILYNVNIRRECLRWAMHDMVANPPTGFESVISNHFRLKATEIFGPQQEVWQRDDPSLQTTFEEFRRLLVDQKLM